MLHGNSTTAAWVTVSVSAATLRAGENDGTALVAAGDFPIYQARRIGRNQVVADQPR